MPPQIHSHHEVLHSIRRYLFATASTCLVAMLRPNNVVYYRNVDDETLWLCKCDESSDIRDYNDIEYICHMRPAANQALLCSHSLSMHRYKTDIPHDSRDKSQRQSQSEKKQQQNNIELWARGRYTINNAKKQHEHQFHFIELNSLKWKPIIRT